MLGRRANGPADPIERFWYYVEKPIDTECWVWTGARFTVGYGQHTVNSAPVYAHRFSYELSMGPIPEGLTIDHLCHNADPDCPGGKCAHKLCVNPTHLEPVSIVENFRRGRERTRRF